MLLLRHPHHPTRRKAQAGCDLDDNDMRSGDARVERPSRAGSAAKEQPPSLTSSKPVTIPSRKSSRPSPRRSTAAPQRTSQAAGHDRNALAPAVAALLAVTAIPARKQPKRRSDHRRISIDELVQQWRSEALSSPSYGSHRSLDILLDVGDDPLETSVESLEALSPSPSAKRTSSSESVPSLDTDGRSLLSLEDPPTPASPRSRRLGLPSLLKSKARSASLSEDCAFNHPLSRNVRAADGVHYHDQSAGDLSADHSPLSSSPASSKASSDKPRSSFTSNLTLSLQSLKTRALSSLSTFTLNTASNLQPSAPQIYQFTDEQLWSHPYIFPRLTTEVRPSPFSGTPTESERRYLNPASRHRPTSPPPTPRHDDERYQLSLEEEQQSYRAALHSPARKIARGDASIAKRKTPMIQMVTYSRTPASSVSPASSSRQRRRGLRRLQASADEKSRYAEASPAGIVPTGMSAILAPPAARQREPRENSAFLRVVVLEMNMRRAGKLEVNVAGRARMWLPPRASGQGNADAMQTCQEAAGRVVPTRWVGTSVQEA